MKFTKILALVVASMMLALALVSCGGGKEELEPIDITVKIIVDGEEKTELFNDTVAVAGSHTVLDAIEAACDKAELDFSYDDASLFVDYTIGDYVTVDNDDGTQTFWNPTIKGNNVDSDSVLEAGQTLVFTYGVSESNKVTVRVYDADGSAVIDEVVNEGLLKDVLGVACDDSVDFDADGKLVEDIGDYETKEDGGFNYYWIYELDGKEVTKYNAAEDEIKGGSTVEFYYIAEEIEEE